jgi:hypothetical protein
MPSKKSVSVSKFETRIKQDKYSSSGPVIFGAVLGIVISMFILNWLVKISKCPCANLPEKEWIREWIMFIIIWQIISLLVYIANDGVPMVYTNIVVAVLSIIVTIINIANIIRIFIYIRRLKEINCDCGLTLQENFIYYWIIFAFAVWGLIAFFGIIAVLFRLFSN